MVTSQFACNFCTLEPFRWQVTRAGAEAARDRFKAEALPDFGTAQDAMLAGQPWMYHALPSSYVNLGVLDPLDLCRRRPHSVHRWYRGVDVEAYEWVEMPNTIRMSQSRRRTPHAG